MSMPCAPSCAKARGRTSRPLLMACPGAFRRKTVKLAHENRDRPDYLDDILAPPIAPGET
jgi:hypothetical protein